MARINQSGPNGVPEVLTRFRSVVGVGAVRGPRAGPGLAIYYWEAWTAADVWRAADVIAPWLCREKRDQLERALGRSDFRLPSPRVDLAPAWCAGFFDAEGSTSLASHRSRAGYKVVEACVTQAGRTAIPDELDRFWRTVGVGRVYGPYAQRGARQPVYRWRAHRPADVRRVIAALSAWLGPVKCDQASRAFAVLDAQPPLARGRIEWGAYKTHCVHGHEYAAARLRPYRSRGVGVQRRDSKQCLVCSREQARARRRPR